MGRDLTGVGERLARLRAERGITTEIVAADTGVPVVDIEAYEAGGRAPGPRVVRQLAQGLDVPYERLAPPGAATAPTPAHVATVQTVGAYLWTLRVQADLTLTEAAGKSGVSERTIRMLERGPGAAWPRAKTLNGLSHAYNVPPEEITATLERITRAAAAAPDALPLPSALAGSYTPKALDLVQRNAFAQAAVRRLRGDRALSARALADLSHLRVNQVGTIERAGGATVLNLRAIARACGVPYARLALQPDGYTGRALSLGQLLTRLRFACGLTQDEVAQRIERTVDTYRRYEYDHIQADYRTLLLLAAGLAMSRKEFLRWVDTLPEFDDVNERETHLRRDVDS